MNFSYLKKSFELATALVALCYVPQSLAQSMSNQLFLPNYFDGPHLSIVPANPLKEKELRLGLFIDRATNSGVRQIQPNEPKDFQRKLSNRLDETLNGTLFSSLGLTSRFSMAASASVILNSEYDRENEVIFAKKTGLYDLALHSHLSLVNGTTMQAGLQTTVGYDLSIDNPFVGDAVPLYIDNKILFSSALPFFNFAFNAGVQYSPARSTESAYPGLDPYGWIGSWSTGIAIGHDTAKILVEYYGQTPLGSYGNPTAGMRVSHETFFGVRLHMGSYDLYFGEASELRHGIGTADLRLIAGLSYRLSLPKTYHSKPARQPAPVAAKPMPKSTPKVAATAPKLVPVAQINPPKHSEHTETLVLYDIKFATNAANIILDKQTTMVLNDVTDLLRRRKPSLIYIYGHTDDIGDYKVNDELSLKRANSVRDHLIARGFDSRFFRTYGYGERMPLYKNTDEYSRKRNRRVELKIVSTVVKSYGH